MGGHGGKRHKVSIIINEERSEILEFSSFQLIISVCYTKTNEMLGNDHNMKKFILVHKSENILIHNSYINNSFKSFLKT
jgi:hypothetical protein